MTSHEAKMTPLQSSIHQLQSSLMQRIDALVNPGARSASVRDKTAEVLNNTSTFKSVTITYPTFSTDTSSPKTDQILDIAKDLEQECERHQQSIQILPLPEDDEESEDEADRQTRLDYEWCLLLHYACNILIGEEVSRISKAQRHIESTQGSHAEMYADQQNALGCQIQKSDVGKRAALIFCTPFRITLNAERATGLTDGQTLSHLRLLQHLMSWNTAEKSRRWPSGQADQLAAPGFISLSPPTEGTSPTKDTLGFESTYDLWLQHVNCFMQILQTCNSMVIDDLLTYKFAIGLAGFEVDKPSGKEVLPLPHQLAQELLDIVLKHTEEMEVKREYFDRVKGASFELREHRLLPHYIDLLGWVANIFANHLSASLRPDSITPGPNDETCRATRVDASRGEVERTMSAKRTQARLLEIEANLLKVTQARDGILNKPEMTEARKRRSLDMKKLHEELASSVGNKVLKQEATRKQTEEFHRLMRDEFNERKDAISVATTTVDADWHSGLLI